MNNGNNYNIVISGVGGQGIIALGTIIARAAMLDGFFVRQSEIHGMSQRGGSVSAFVRIANDPIPSDIVPTGHADMILSMEPLESLRYVHILRKNGVLLTAKDTVVNIPNYPNVEEIYNLINLIGNAIIVDAKEIAKKAGSVRAVNIALIGAAAKHLPIKRESLEKTISEYFASKGEAVVEANIKAFRGC